MVSCCLLICGRLCRGEDCDLTAEINWPSSRRRQFKVLVCKGVDSNPTSANPFFLSSPAPSFISSFTQKHVSAVLLPGLLDCCFRQTVARTSDCSLRAGLSPAM